MQVAISVISSSHRRPLFDDCLYPFIHHIQHEGKQYGLERYALNTWRDVQCPSQARHEAVMRARSQRMSHVLFVGDDILFPTHALKLLRERNQGFIGINTIDTSHHKQMRQTATAPDGTELDSRGKTGLAEAGSLPFAFLLIDLVQLDRVPGPYFEVHWNEKKGAYDTDDVFFGNQLRKHNIKLMVDHDLTQQCARIGDFAYNAARFNAG